jgi:hypothetical protein
MMRVRAFESKCESTLRINLPRRTTKRYRFKIRRPAGGACVE